MSTHKKYPNNKHPLIWAAAINLNGAWGPCRMKYDEECDTYFDKGGDFSVEGCGVYDHGGLITYGNTDRSAVELWIKAVKTTMDFIKKRLECKVYRGDNK